MRFEAIADEAILVKGVAPIAYDSQYFAKLISYSESSISKDLLAFRKAYVDRFARAESVLDFGCGCGELVLANSNWFGYDIIPEVKTRLGNKFDAEYSKYSAICFFDVLEHLQNPLDVLNSLSSGVIVVVSMPMISTLERVTEWKHWKPGEHFLYCSVAGFENMIKKAGHKLLDVSFEETRLGRQDICTCCLEIK